MDVTIYYTENYSESPSGIERITTPIESVWDRWRINFKQVNTKPDTWCLMIERHNLSSWVHPTGILPLKQKCGNMADYTNWLAENVALIEVDGRRFWANPKLGGDE